MTTARKSDVTMVDKDVKEQEPWEPSYTGNVTYVVTLEYGMEVLRKIKNKELLLWCGGNKSDYYP